MNKYDMNRVEKIYHNGIYIGKHECYCDSKTRDGISNCYDDKHNLIASSENEVLPFQTIIRNFYLKKISEHESKMNSFRYGIKV